MRRFLPFLLLFACSPQPEDSFGSETVAYAGAGRDRLCTAGGEAGFIAYGNGNTNCSVSGMILERSSSALVIAPHGDSDCKISATVNGGIISLGPRSDACAYYCGPDADFSGRTFTRQDGASPAVDFAGDPLC